MVGPEQPDGGRAGKPDPAPALDRDLANRVDRLVDETLFATAEQTDRADRLPVGHFRALAELGLNGMVVPRADGGLGLSPPQVRAVLRRLGSGCGSTAFAFAQHHGTTASVVSTANTELREAWLGRLTTTDLAGIAYAHVRRSGPPVLRARPTDRAAEPHRTTWLLDGQAPWVTSWGLAEVLGVAARTDDGRLLWALVPAREGDGLRMAKRFDLAVLGSSMTVALDFDRYRVQPTHLLDVVELDPWAAHDRQLAARPNPLCLGIGDRAIRLLGEAEPEAARLIPAWTRLADQAEAQSRAVDQGRADLGRVAMARAETVLATQRLTAALLAAIGGKAMERDHPAQRLHREAGFYVVQALNDVGRQAILDRIAAWSAEPDL